jgi:5-methylthioadenosine/S-adenosylhomocysteine deaminase
MAFRLEGGIVVTLNPDNQILDGGVVVVCDDRIAYVGSREGLPAEYDDFAVYPMQGKVIFPGFVNIHTHVALSILRGIGDDMGVAPAYAPGIPQGVFLSPSEARILSLLGGLEALKFGTTCIADNYIYADQAASAFDELGLRAVVSERLHDADLFKVPHGVYEFNDKMGHDMLQRGVELAEKWHGQSNGRITCRLGPHAPDTCSTIYLHLIQTIAENMGLSLVTHVAQSQREIKEIKTRSGKSPVTYLEEIGLLGPQMIAGHCIYVSDEDIDILAQTRTHVSHQSGSNAKGGMMAPIKRMLDKGVNVGLGTDNMAGDMVEVMRLAVLVARMLDQDQMALCAVDALRMATINGAKALGMEQEIGTIEAEKKADLVVMGLQKSHLVPVVDPVANIVHNGLGSDVEMVVVDGQILIEDGEPKTINEQALLKEAQRVTRCLWDKMPGGLPAHLRWFDSAFGDNCQQ